MSITAIPLLPTKLKFTIVFRISSVRPCRVRFPSTSSSRLHRRLTSQEWIGGADRKVEQTLTRATGLMVSRAKQLIIRPHRYLQPMRMQQSPFIIGQELGGSDRILLEMVDL